jgi:hypothetical protein
MKYLLKDGDGDWYEVSKRQWVMAERFAGFFNRTGRPDEPATSSWSAFRAGLDMSGKIESTVEEELNALGEAKRG